MQLTRTALIHPTMIKKIRSALYYASKGQGHKMNGHGRRCYIQNAQGRNIMRLDWVSGRQGYIVYGNESVVITRTVRNALQSVIVRELVKPQYEHKAIEKDSEVVGYKSRLATMGKMFGIAAASAIVSGCSVWPW